MLIATYQPFVFPVLLLAMGGVLAGLLAGLFGLGGGTILVPILYEFLRLTDTPPEWRMHVALGTSLAIIVPTSIRSYLGHRKRGAADGVLLKRWLIAVPIGVLCGAFIASFVPSFALKIIFVCICILTATRFLVGTHRGWSLGSEMPKNFTIEAQGFGIGFLSSLMGMGGGVFSTMLLTFYKRTIHQAVATSAGVGVLVSVPGAIGYIVAGMKVQDQLTLWPLGFVAVLPLLLMGPLSALTTPFGVRLAHKFSKRRLEFALGVYLCLIAARFFSTLL